MKIPLGLRSARPVITISVWMDSTALYIHIPFCHRICHYCAFAKTLWSETQSEALVSALCTEIEAYGNRVGRLPIRTLFMGGGTPSSLSSSQLSRLFDTLYRVFDVSASCEKTMEVNPESVSHSLLNTLKDYHFNRISMGVQSFVPSELKALGRAHRPDRVGIAVDMFREHGFDNFNLDLIFGLKSARLEDLAHSLAEAIRLDPTHLSIYSLSIESGTVFKRRRVTPLHSDEAAVHYKLIQRTLASHGYRQYEVSAFSKKGYTCRHNLAYWNLDPFIGIGPSADSFFDGYTYRQTSDIAAYIQTPTPPLYDGKRRRRLSPTDRMKDYIVANLRRLDGIDLAEFERRFGQPFLSFFSKPAAALIEQRLLILSKKRIRVSANGLYVLDPVLMKLLD